MEHHFSHLKSVFCGKYTYSICLQVSESSQFQDSQAGRSDLLWNAALKSGYHARMTSIHAMQLKQWACMATCLPDEKRWEFKTHLDSTVLNTEEKPVITVCAQMKY